MIVTGPAAIDKSGARPPDLAPTATDAVGEAAVTVLGPDTPVILDSNVWIDLLVFADPAVAPIRSRLEADRLHVVVDDACLRELSYVLLYPQFARFAVDDQAALAQTRTWTHAVASIAAHEEAVLQAAAGSAPILPARPVPPSSAHPVLPRCSDRDDQKFLTLAAVTGARWLVTKDKALLKLHRRMLRDFNCHVVLPAVFTALALGHR